jgi:hypothetical protein
MFCSSCGRRKRVRRRRLNLLLVFALAVRLAVGRVELVLLLLLLRLLLPRLVVLAPFENRKRAAPSGARLLAFSWRFSSFSVWSLSLSRRVPANPVRSAACPCCCRCVS